MSTHTPGPWEFFEKVGKIATFDYDIAELWQGPPEWRANGRLIAAAPDFYHAATVGAQLNLPDLLEWVAARLIRFGDNPKVDFVLTLYDRAKLLRAAIAKAEGKSE